MNWRAALLSAVFLTGCSTGTAPDEDRSLGIIQGVIGSEPLISVPGSIQVGRQLRVSVRTFGYNSCWAMGTTDVSVGESAAVLRPFDIPPSPSSTTGCLSAIVEFDHEASISFSSPGEKRLEVWGRDGVRGDTVRVELWLTVTPQ